VRMGFELEFAAPLTWRMLRYYLKKELGEKYDKVILKTTEDYSIRAPSHWDDNNALYAELVTRDLPRREALAYLRQLLHWMESIGAVTNKSTGLHVNYSDRRAQKHINPVSVLTTIDSMSVMSEFGRENNRFCRPFEYYLKYIKRDVKKAFRKDKTSIIEKSVGKIVLPNEIDTFVYSATLFLHWIRDGYRDFSSNIDRYNISAKSEFSNKNVCLNLGYISRRNYIESRMIGGNYLKKQDEVFECIEKVEDGLMLACDKKYNTKRNYKYLKEFYLT